MRRSDLALRVVKDWVKHMIYVANVAKPAFLTTFVTSALLGLEYDAEGILESIRQAPCLAYNPPPKMFIRRDYNAYIMHDLEVYLKRFHPSCLSAGVLFFR